MASKEILILRHGKSDWSVDVPDFERPLTDRGRRDAQRIGNYLRDRNILPDAVISSPARRAFDTAIKCVKATGLTPSIIEPEPALYHASRESLLELCEQVSGRTMIVGHNPGLDELLTRLVPSHLKFTRKGKLMTTANLARLRIDDGEASLLAHVRPSKLPRTFTFNLEGGGQEQRDRPQYYYNQSAALPYRHRDGDIEVLLIAHLGSKSWSVPKGIVEPGYSAWDSAAKEAREEAGAVGEINPAPIGSFRINKWGADMDVPVFPLRVDAVLDDGEWEDDMRHRRWFSQKKAAKKARHAALAEMILDIGH